MRKATSLLITFVLFVLMLTVGCGGGSSNSSNSGNPTPSQGISGAYEFVATSTTTSGSVTLIEANLSVGRSRVSL